MKKLWKLLPLAAVLFLAACTQQETAAENTQNIEQEEEAENVTEMPGSVKDGQKYLVTMQVKDYGTIEVEIDEGIAPLTVENFLKLVNEGFYDGLTFHRIVEGFVIQGGDPLGNGMGGSEESIKGEFYSNGFNNTLRHSRGVISMARAYDPDSASSQFFIMLEDNFSLDGDYAAFGKVVDGMDVVDAIAANAIVEDSNGTVASENQPVIESVTAVKIEE